MIKRDLLTFGAGAVLALAALTTTGDVETGWDFYEKGEKRVRAELVQDATGAWVREGLFERWYENGALHMRGSMRADREEGPWHKYYDTGQLKKKLSFSAGAIHGAYESWYVNGQKSSEGEFSHGAPVGTWKVWDETGAIDPARSGRYEEGELVSD